jgi:phosphohistidine phosphatase
MKKLTVLRHAKSSWAEPNRDDFDRPLNERGWKAARRMGRELKHRKIGFDLCLASPAARVRETLDGLSETYGDFPFPVTFHQQIYLADTGTLLELVRGVGDGVERLLLVGHNPGLERLVAMLTRDDGKGLRDEVEHKFPTAALAVIELGAGPWSEVEPAGGEVVELILPKELD